jgi:hypothetical protein
MIKIWKFLKIWVFQQPKLELIFKKPHIPPMKIQKKFPMNEMKNSLYLELCTQHYFYNSTYVLQWNLRYEILQEGGVSEMCHL